MSPRQLKNRKRSCTESPHSVAAEVAQSETTLFTYDVISGVLQALYQTGARVGWPPQFSLQPRSVHIRKSDSVPQHERRQHFCVLVLSVIGNAKFLWYHRVEGEFVYIFGFNEASCCDQPETLTQGYYSRVVCLAIKAAPRRRE